MEWSLSRMVIWRSQSQSERDHLRTGKTGPIVESHGWCVAGIGQQGDATTASGAGLVNGFLQQLFANALAAPMGMHHHIFQPGRDATLRCAHGEKKIDHAHYDRVIVGRAIDTSDLRLLQDEPKPPRLPSGIGGKIRFLSEQEREQVAELRNISDHSLPYLNSSG